MRAPGDGGSWGEPVRWAGEAGGNGSSRHRGGARCGAVAGFARVVRLRRAEGHLRGELRLAAGGCGGLGAVTGGAGGQRAWEGGYVDLFAPWSLAPLLIRRRGKISAW